MKDKRIESKELTSKINSLKRNIDSTKEKLDKKEEERKLEARVKNQEELFDDEDGPNDEIIDAMVGVHLHDMP